MDEATARRTVEALLGSYRRFNDLAADVFSDGSYQQAVEFRKLVGHILGTISVGFFMPLFQQFPALKPEEFKGPYEPLPSYHARRPWNFGPHLKSSGLASPSSRRACVPREHPTRFKLSSPRSPT